MHRLIHVLKRTSLVKWVDKANKKKLVLDSKRKVQARELFVDDVDRLDRLFPDLSVKTRWGYDR